MGRVRTQTVKRLARLLMEKFPGIFTSDFESNKRILSEIAGIPTKRLRNQLAGYITSVIATEQRAKRTTNVEAMIDLAEKEALRVTTR